MEGKLSWIVSDASDYKGSPADRSKTGGWVPAALILGVELCERLATMGIAVNLVTYLIGTMHLPSSTSANIVTDFLGTCFLLCFVGGFLADTFLGRYKTVAIFAVIQALGTCMLAVITALPRMHPLACQTTIDGTQLCEKATGFQIGALYMVLYLIALGTGGLKSSVSGFGSDQFDEKDDKEAAQRVFFFSRFFFFISLGGLLAVTVLVYIQDEVGRSMAYGICSVSMAVAIALFLAGTKRYRFKRSACSPFVHIMQVASAAVEKRRLELPYDVNLLYEDSDDSSRIHHTQQFGYLDKAAIVREEDFEKEGNGDSIVAVANPWKVSSVTRVEEVKMVIRLLPIWATTIMFWTTYAQMITFSVEQASTMERSIGGFQIPAGSLTVFFVSAILISLGVYDRLVMPLWKRFNGKPGLTNLQRVALGLALSILGMISAAIVEKKRLSVARAIAMEGQDTQATLPITVFILIPQFFLVGAGEAFIYTGQLDFFITESPKGMKTMSTGLFLTTLSFGFFLSSFLVAVVKGATSGGGRGHGWLADSINHGRLDFFYALLAVLSFINFMFFWVCAIWYKNQKPKGSASAGISSKKVSGSCEV